MRAMWGVMRAELVGALRCVDYVVIFNEPTVDRILNLLKPERFPSTKPPPAPTLRANTR